MLKRCTSGSDLEDEDDAQIDGKIAVICCCEFQRKNHAQ